MYRITRDESDCCGVSLVGVFERANPAEEISILELEEVLGVVAKQEEPVDWMLRHRGVGGVWSGSPVQGLKDYLFPVARYAVVLDPDRDVVTKEVGDLVGASEVELVYSAPLEPAPSVHGRVDVASTADRRFLVVMVMDEGA
jgi:hypothetical protein